MRIHIRIQVVLVPTFLNLQGAWGPFSYAATTNTIWRRHINTHKNENYKLSVRNPRLPHTVL